MAFETDDDIPVGGQGPEFPTEPAAPAQTTGLFLTASVKRAIGNGTMRLDATKTCVLPPITPGAQSAIMVMEPAPGATPGRVLARFWMDGTWPGVASGLPIYEGSIIEIIGLQDLTNTRIISTDGLQHKLNVQYFSI
ncbi:hypothetical protein DYU05_03930 [Mucilaginibacter terrenus]|uniref:Uncharacterized protein n=1 Tax=Mucilaginibacter terrenus TaxID=2482727 RepID=A0A3E2NUT0_9SPHI|nr:hypothetical protein [Mucilaginibacter terrenus]RFZ84764.1 hypothetical protein DYU05_03930 [Mucilaginibacter terrenus]